MFTGWTQKSLLLLMLFTLTGAHWALLQSAAWAGMLVNRVRTDRLPQAISATFDGRHPCPLCKAVQSGRKSEGKAEVVIKIPQAEFPPMDTFLAADVESTSGLTVAPSDEFAESLINAPLLRPPRSFFF